MTQVASHQSTQQLDPQAFGDVLKDLIPIAVKHGPDVLDKILGLFATEPGGQMTPQSVTPTGSSQHDGQLDPQFWGAIASAIVPIAIQHGPDLAKTVLDLFMTEPTGQMSPQSAAPPAPTPHVGQLDPQSLEGILKDLLPIAVKHGPTVVEKILDLFVAEPVAEPSGQMATQSVTPTGSSQHDGQFDPQFWGAIASAIVPIAIKHGPDIAKTVLDLFMTEPTGQVQ